MKFKEKFYKHLLKPIGERTLCKDCQAAQRIQILKEALGIACRAIGEKREIKTPPNKPSLRRYLYDVAEETLRLKKVLDKPLNNH